MDQGPSLQSITPSFCTVSSPAVSESYNQAVHNSAIQPVSQNLLQNSHPLLVNHMQHPSINKQIQGHNLDLHINQPTLHTLPQNSMNHIASGIHSCSDSQMMHPHIDNQAVEDMIDEELTQPCLDDDFIQSNIDIENDLSNMVDDINTATFEDDDKQDPEHQIGSNVFESIGKGKRNLQPIDAGNLQNKSNELPTSDDDYIDPATNGPVSVHHYMLFLQYVSFYVQ